MAKRTRTVQHVEVGDGLALGILTSGVDAIMSNKMAVDFGFRHAWRRWALAPEYPQVNAGPSRDDIYNQIIGRSGGRRFSYAAWRHDGGKLFPYVALESWSVTESLDALADPAVCPYRDGSSCPRSSWDG